MKKLFLTIAVLAFSATAFAQDREIDLDDIENFNKVEIAKSNPHVESNATFGFPMYFGATTLTNINYKGAWANTGLGNFLDFNLPRSFMFGIEVVNVNFRFGAVGLSLGVRYTYMDLTFQNNYTTIDMAGNPMTIAPTATNGKKSKIHATYSGVPARLSLNFGKASIYAGATLDVLLDGYAKYKQPKTRYKVPVFNRFRGTVEGGFSYGNLGVFVMYGLTPVFDSDLSDAHTLTFGLLLGL